MYLRGDRELWLCRNSVLSSVRSPGPGGPLLSCRQKCSSCFVGGSRTTFTVSSCTGSGAPRRLGSFRDSMYSSEKLLEDEWEHHEGAAPPQLLPAASKRRRAPLHPYQHLSAVEHCPDLGEHHCSVPCTLAGHPANLLSNAHNSTDFIVG